jgi:hypothetical protein
MGSVKKPAVALTLDVRRNEDFDDSDIVRTAHWLPIIPFCLASIVLGL